MCYCGKSERVILCDLKQETFPDESLVTSCCWRTICRVRGKNISQIKAETWVDVCRKRGYLFARQNPRGF